MKKMMTLLSMIALAFVGTMMIGCSNKEYDIEQPEQPEQPVGSENVITLTTTINLPDTDTDTDETKALGIDYDNKKLSKTFAVGEKMAVLYRSQTGLTRDISDPLTAEDITNGGKTAKFTFQFYYPVKTEDVTYVYPAAMVGGSSPYHIDYSRLNTQNGTLASIASDLDLATYTGPWVDGNLPAANLTNELAIIAYILKNADGSVDLTSTITGMTINDGTYNYTVNRNATAGPIYVAIRPTNDATINYTATDGTTNNYKKTVSEKTYETGQFYQLGLRMTPASSATGYALKDSHVGDVVGSDGFAYAPEDRNNLPAYASVAGMVAYKDGENGLVIALSNESAQWWSDAVNATIAHTPAVTGHAWRMPKLAEWKQMFAAFGGSEASCAGLNTALANIGGTGLQSGQQFWTSTRTGNTSANYVKIGDASTVTDYSASMDYNMIPRACLFFGYDRNAFSVSLMTKVTFARGNLRYTGSKWEFLSNSWDCGYNGNHGKTSGSQYFAWNDVFKDASVSIASDIKDDVANDLGSTWRGLSTEEWRYLLGYDGNNSGVQSPRRSVAWHRYAMVDDTKRGEGRYLLIFPDGFKESDWNTSTMGTKPTEFEQYGILYDSGYTTSNFTAMGNAGVVVLPPTGYWLSDWGYVYTGTSYYWSCTCADANGAMMLLMNAPGTVLFWQNKTERNFPVRLVKNVE